MIDLDTIFGVETGEVCVKWQMNGENGCILELGHSGLHISPEWMLFRCAKTEMCACRCSSPLEAYKADRGERV